MALAYAFAIYGMFGRKSGGMGGYAEYAFGKSGSFMANYTYGVSLLIANIAIAISAVGYGTELFDTTLSPLGICIATIGVLWLATVAQLRWRAHHQQNQRHLRLGRDHSGGGHLGHRLVLVQRQRLRRRLEPHPGADLQPSAPRIQ